MITHTHATCTSHDFYIYSFNVFCRWCSWKQTVPLRFSRSAQFRSLLIHRVCGSDTGTKTSKQNLLAVDCSGAVVVTFYRCIQAACCLWSTLSNEMRFDGVMGFQIPKGGCHISCVLLCWCSSHQTVRTTPTTSQINEMKYTHTHTMTHLCIHDTAKSQSPRQTFLRLRKATTDCLRHVSSINSNSECRKGTSCIKPLLKPSHCSTQLSQPPILLQHTAGSHVEHVGCAKLLPASLPSKRDQRVFGNNISDLEMNLALRLQGAATTSWVYRA